MQFASWKIFVLFSLVGLQLACSTPTKVSAPSRPGLNGKTSKLSSGTVDAFGVKFIIRAANANAVTAGLNEVKRLSSLYDAQSGRELC